MCLWKTALTFDSYHSLYMFVVISFLSFFLFLFFKKLYSDKLVSKCSKNECGWFTCSQSKICLFGTTKRQYSLASTILLYLAAKLKLMCVLCIVLSSQSPSSFHLSVKSLYTSRLRKSFKASECEVLRLCHDGGFLGTTQALPPHLSETPCHFTHSESQSHSDIIMGKNWFASASSQSIISETIMINRILNELLIILFAGKHSQDQILHILYRLISCSGKEDIYSA